MIDFIKLAEAVAEGSKDPSTKVGAVVLRPDRTVVGVGYNGFPRGIADDPERLHDRETKYALTVHAELNAILNSKESLEGCTIYVTHPPCVSCACAIIQAGIQKVIYKRPDADLLSRWRGSLNQALLIMNEAGLQVEVTPSLQEAVLSEASPEPS